MKDSAFYARVLRQVAQASSTVSVDVMQSCCEARACSQDFWLAFRLLLPIKELKHPFPLFH